jgi:hypothetical protein
MDFYGNAKLDIQAALLYVSAFGQWRLGTTLNGPPLFRLSSSQRSSSPATFFW